MVKQRIEGNLQSMFATSNNTNNAGIYFIQLSRSLIGTVPSDVLQLRKNECHTEVCRKLFIRSPLLIWTATSYLFRGRVVCQTMRVPWK